MSRVASSYNLPGLRNLGSRLASKLYLAVGPEEVEYAITHLDRGFLKDYYCLL
jgi:hypothetical protein